MTAPIRYMRTATFRGQVSFFTKKLDPQQWEPNAPDIWTASYLIDSPPAGAVQSVTQGPATSLARSELADNRSATPRKDPASPLTRWGPPNSDGLFFEEVLFAGFTYQNVLRTTYVDDSKNATAPIIRFEYKQYDCLRTMDDNGAADGGIDVDNGIVECVRDPEDPGQVQITISKMVRFTQPKYCVDEINALATVLVPLTFDSWLHDLIFG